MAWQETLQDASFRGVPFDVLSTTDNNKQAVITHSIPYVNGGSLEPTGYDPRSFSVSAIIWGEDYENRLTQLELALNQISLGQLIHPTRGVLTVAVQDYSVKHLEEEVETARIDILFIEEGFITELFSLATPQEPTEALAEAAILLFDVATEKLAQELAVVSESAIFSDKQRALRLDEMLLKSLQDLRKQVQSTVSNLEKAINAPYEFASNIANLCDGLIDLRAFDVDIIAAKWHNLRGQFKNILRLPNDGKSLNAKQQRDNRVFNQYMDSLVLRSNTLAASQLFTNDIESPTLTPLEVESISNTLRADGQQLINTIRQSNSPLSQQDLAVIEAIKKVAYQAQRTGLALLARKPPLIERKVENAISLHLLAHFWYADHTRAAELLRLNPKITHPNFIEAGEVLNGYSR
jgi:prophage DNA circulation protein